MADLELIKDEAKNIFKAGFLRHEVTVEDYLNPKHKHKIYTHLEKIIQRVCLKNRFSIEPNELQKIEDIIINEVFGFGVIDNLIRDQDVTDILVNNPQQVYIEKNGKLEKIDLKFDNQDELYYILERMVQESGRRIDISTPYVDFRLEGGVRVTAVIPPVSPTGPFFCIRKVYKEILTFQDLVRLGTLDQKLLDFIKYSVKARLNILVSGSTGAGKTTLMHLMIKEFVPPHERVVVLEDTEEIVPEGDKHVIKLLTRPPSIEGKGEITLRDLVKLSLHLRPDRIVIGEVRSEEAFHFLHVINTGHEGSMCTVHASNPEDALNRLEVLSLMDRVNITPAVIHRFLRLGIDIIIHMVRLSDGRRVVSQVSEFDYEDSHCIVKDIFSWHKGFRDNKELSEIRYTGHTPSFFPKLKARTDIPEDFFML